MRLSILVFLLTLTLEICSQNSKIDSSFHQTEFAVGCFLVKESGPICTLKYAPKSNCKHPKFQYGYNVLGNYYIPKDNYRDDVKFRGIGAGMNLRYSLLKRIRLFADLNIGYTYRSFKSYTSYIRGRGTYYNLYFHQKESVFSLLSYGIEVLTVKSIGISLNGFLGANSEIKNRINGKIKNLDSPLSFDYDYSSLPFISIHYYFNSFK